MFFATVGEALVSLFYFITINKVLQLTLTLDNEVVELFTFRFSGPVFSPLLELLPTRAMTSAYLSLSRSLG